MLVNIDLRVAIRHQIPILLDKVAPTPMFVIGKCARQCLVRLIESTSRFSSDSVDQNPLPRIQRNFSAHVHEHSM